MLYVIMLVALSVAVSWPLGKLAAWAMNDPVSDYGFRHAAENLFVKCGGRVVSRQQTWKNYALSMLLFNVLIFIAVFLVLGAQQWLPLNPDAKGALEGSLIFNTTASFTTNTNLQHYSGEQALSYIGQFALMFLQYLTPATGLACLAALARGLSGKVLMGNFYADVMRATFLVLLPVCVVTASMLVLGGVIMTFDGSVVAHTLEGAKQIIARGPVAAFVTIKQLGTNGGGFFGPNSTHPFENAGFFTNVVETMALIVIPMACVWMYGRITGRMKHAVVIFAVMLSLLCVKLGCAVYFESAPAAAFNGLDIENSSNLEGKELRYGTTGGPAWSVFTTATSNGSVNAMHDSLNPLSGLMPMIGMWLNVVFGGVGVGFINMFLYIIVGVFISGMMVGRTPEYLGKKIEGREMKLTALCIIIHPLLILAFSALAVGTAAGREGITNPGFHGLSQVLYEYASSAANNGSGFEGLADNTCFWNITAGLAMFFGRYLSIVIQLAIAGSLMKKNFVNESAGTLRTDTVSFSVILVFVVYIFAALTFFPALALGPVAEHLALWG